MLATSAWHLPYRIGVPRWLVPTVVVVAVVISAAYGTGPDLRDESDQNALLGAMIGVIHLCGPLVLAIFAMTLAAPAVRLIFTLVMAVALASLAFWLINLLSTTTSAKVNAQIAALELAAAFVLAIVCASVAVVFSRTISDGVGQGIRQ